VGTRRRSGEPRHETRSGVDGISFTVHPLGTMRPFDRICAARIRQSWSLDLVVVVLWGLMARWVAQAWRVGRRAPWELQPISMVTPSSSLQS